ncbi:hypothetical protein BDZ88DRAFT_409596, partial [Geranomyces variabilis]
MFPARFLFSGERLSLSYVSRETLRRRLKGSRSKDESGPAELALCAKSGSSSPFGPSLTEASTLFLNFVSFDIFAVMVTISLCASSYNRCTFSSRALRTYAAELTEIAVKKHESLCLNLDFFIFSVQFDQSSMKFGVFGSNLHTSLSKAPLANPNKPVTHLLL